MSVNHRIKQACRKTQNIFYMIVKHALEISAKQLSRVHTERV